MKAAETTTAFVPTNKVREYQEHSLDLAIIGNCTISAMIDQRGKIVYACFPRYVGEELVALCLLS